MARKQIMIDGSHFSTLAEFYDEADRILTRNLTWRTGHNLDAFHDLLRGGFGVHEYGEGVDFFWIHSEKSRRDLGYEETIQHWENVLKKCHPTSRKFVKRKLADAQNHTGPTLFAMIVEDILNKESIYDHTLTLDGRN